jgi:hypothetical protein
MATVSSLIKEAMKNDWVTGKEALGIIKEAQRNGVTASEFYAVDDWMGDMEEDGTRIANGTQAMLDRFVARHEGGPVDMETVDLAELLPVFESIDFWYGRRELSPTYLRYTDLPAAVRDQLPRGIDTSYYSFELKGETVYVADYEGASDFAINIFSEGGRRLYNLEGQQD